MSEHLMTKSEMLPGSVVGAATAEAAVTGSWRTYLPITDFENCVHCLRCWIFCPEGAVKIEDGKRKGIDLKYCKGCGICATECKAECMEMKLEAEVSPEMREKQQGE